jgi:hypothetical protein
MTERGNHVIGSRANLSGDVNSQDYETDQNKPPSGEATQLGLNAA